MKEEAKGKGDVLRKLFFSCLYLSTFTFGGGYVIVTHLTSYDPLYVKDRKEWLKLYLPARTALVLKKN